MTAEPTTRVVIAGGGVAALETALALRELAGDRVALALLAPNSEFNYRPMTVREPFAYAPAEHHSLAEIAADIGAELIVGEFGWVDSERQIAYTATAEELPYDALMLALGARTKEPFAHVLTIDDRRMDALLHGVVQDLEEGYVHSIGFVAPARMGWPLPLYELALMMAARAYDMDVQVEISVVTPEEAPLAIFGPEASSVVAALLADAGINTISAAHAQVPEAGQILIEPEGAILAVDRVIALPELFGPAVRGLPAGEHGFITIDPHGQVRGVPRVFAAGDATDFAVKFGGVAAAQADAAAESIAALAGAPVTPSPFQPEIHGMLLTGRKPLYLTARLSGTRGFSSQITDEPTSTPPAKIAARYLAPYLELRASRSR